MPQWIEAAHRGEIADKTSKVIALNGSEVAVFNLNGEYFAIEDVCTHDGGDLSGGWVEGDHAVCPRHLAEFSIRTGAALKAPAYEGVHSFLVRVRGDAIEVCDDRGGQARDYGDVPMISNRLSRWTLLFFAFALVNFLAAQGLIVAGLTWPAHSVSAPGTLIAVHLLTIGWLLLLMLGALFQFIPVITSNPLPSQRVTLATLITVQAGLIGMICGFAGLGWVGPVFIRCLPVGGALVIIGVLIACYDLGVPLLKARPLTLPGRMVLTGLAFLLVTVTLGLLFALVLSVPGFATYVIPWLAHGVAYHALAGLGGWFTLTAMGVSYKLLPMFTLAPEDRGRVGEAVHQFGAAGFALAIVAGLIGAWYGSPMMRILEVLGYAAVAVAVIIYLWDVLRIYRSRKRAVIELHNKAAVGAFILLSSATALAIVLMSIGTFPTRLPAFVFLVVFGWLSGLGLTQLYKIVPFLTWLDRFGQKLGRESVPRVQDLVDESHSYPWFVTYFIGVVLSGVAALAGAHYMFRAGVGLSALATLGLIVEYWRAWRGYYSRYRPSAPPASPFLNKAGLPHDSH